MWDLSGILKRFVDECRKMTGKKEEEKTAGTEKAVLGFGAGFPVLFLAWEAMVC